MMTLLWVTVFLLMVAYAGSERTTFGHPHSRLQDHQEDELFAPLKVMCEINGFSVPAIIDTGAQISIMSSSCARRCHLYQQINRQFSGKALGVGSGEIIGRIDSMGVRMGPLTFNSRISVLRDSHVDFLIGLDFLKRFRGEVNLKENVLKLVVKDKHIRIPFFSESRYGYSSSPYDDDEKNHSHVCVGHSESDEGDKSFTMKMPYSNDMDLEKEIDEDIKNLDVNSMNSKRVREVYCMEHARHPKEEAKKKNSSRSTNHPSKTLLEREKSLNNNDGDDDGDDDDSNDNDVVSMEGI